MKARPVKKLDPGTALAENAARIVAVRLDELRGFTPRALEFENAPAQHDMRIAAKRLRYVLEATDFCFGKPAHIAARRARDLQSLLGELHDCDVMLPVIESQISDLRAEDAAAVREHVGDASDVDPRLAARARHRTAYRGLELLAIHVQARRKLHFDRFLAFWHEQEAVGTWRRLEQAVARRLQEEREQRQTAQRVERARRALEKAEQDEHAAADRARRAAAELACAQDTPGEPAVSETAQPIPLHPPSGSRAVAGG